jgi:hypothetical protein
MLFFFLHFAVKIGYGPLHTVGGHKRMIGDIFHFYSFACLARQDHDLPHNIRASQVQPRIRFGVSFILRLLHNLGEFPLPVIIIKNKIQGTTQHSLHFMNTVTTVYQVV